VGFIAKTSESGVGVSNCITTTYSTTGYESSSYSTLTFAAETATDVTDESWTIFTPSYSASWEPLDFTLIPQVCEHEITAPTYLD